MARCVRCEPRPALFSLHIGRHGAELVSSTASPPPKVSRLCAVGDVRTHIRVPGGVFAVSILSDADELAYAAVNAGPMEVSGMVCVRWKLPRQGTYVATLWKQRDKIGSKPADVRSFLETCTKVTHFSFIVE